MVQFQTAAYMMGRFKVAYCWAHTRRDFIRAVDSDCTLEEWVSWWLRVIGCLYHTANLRREQLADPGKVKYYTARIRRIFGIMEKNFKRELKKKSLKPIQRKILKRLEKHWRGLTVFVDYPFLQLDNNTAERALRPEVIGRKNYNGSGSEWAASFAALMFSLFQTLKLWGLNERLWLREAFSYIKSDQKDKLHELLPWNLSEEKRQKLKLSIATNTS